MFTSVICYRERNTELIREAIHTRYMFLPYFYTLFREANMTGTPVIRPLWMEFPAEEETFSNDEAFMVGNSLLVQGVYTQVIPQGDKPSYFMHLAIVFYIVIYYILS